MVPADAIREQASVAAPERLCSEIRLFDLCELDSCRFLRGRFCTDPDLIARFEAIAEKDESQGSRYDRPGDDEAVGDEFFADGFDDRDDEFDGDED